MNFTKIFQCNECCQIVQFNELFQIVQFIELYQIMLFNEHYLIIQFKEHLFCLICLACVYFLKTQIARECLRFMETANLFFGNMTFVMHAG